MRRVEEIKNKDVRVDAPPSKAHTLRALILSSLAEGESRIINPLLGEDQLNVIESLKKLGVHIDKEGNTLIVKGMGGRFSPKSHELNVGESGVGMNFLTSVCCYSDRELILTGKESLLRRPIKEVVDGVKQLGGKVEYIEKEGYPPIKIYNEGLKGGEAKIFGSKTSQYFSSITIAAPLAKKEVKLQCLDTMTETPYYDITLDMMEKFGVKSQNNNYKEIIIPKGQKYKCCDIKVEGDYSSASFFFLGAAICKSRVTVGNLSSKTCQGDREFLDLLEKMGCIVSIGEDETCVEGKELNAITVDMSDIPDLVPPFAIAAAFANGTTRITNIGHLRHKECDRLAVVVEELNKMGAIASYDETSMTITGSQSLHGAVIDPHNDHRIAMSFAVAGLVTGNQQIENEGCVAKSFPDFWERFKVFEENK